MDNYVRQRRGLFEGLKVPFCLHALLLAFIGMWVFRGGVYLIETAFGVPGLFADLLNSILYNRFTAPILPFFGVDASPKVMPFKLTLYALPFFALWFLVVWSVFAGAINRIYAMRISRDETVEFFKALGYGFQHAFTHLASVIFIVVAILFFYFCNVLAGLVGLIPYAGEIVLIPLYFLALISAILITLLVVGGLFGWNLISSSIAVDGVDTFDGISRAYSYVYGRPWQTILYHILPAIFLIVFFAGATFFVEVSQTSIGVGMGDKWKATSIEAADRFAPEGVYNKIVAKDSDDSAFGYIQEDLSGPVAKGNKQAYKGALRKLEATYTTKPWKFSRADWEGDETLQKIMKEAGHPGIDATLTEEVYLKAKEKLESVIDAASAEMLGFADWIFKAIFFVVIQFIYAYMISYWLGAQTKAYFLLRHDVDGDDFEEVYTDDDDDDILPFDSGEIPPEITPAPVTPDEKKDEEEKDEKKEEEKPKKSKPKKKRSRKKTKQTDTKKKKD